MVGEICLQPSRRHSDVVIIHKDARQYQAVDWVAKVIKSHAYGIKQLYASKTYPVYLYAQLCRAAKMGTSHHTQAKMYIIRWLYTNLPQLRHSSRRNTLVSGSTHDIVKHAGPDLLENANLLLDGFLHRRRHEVCDGVEVDAVGVAVVRVGHGQDDGEGCGADDLGFGDDLVGLLDWVVFVHMA